MKADSSHRQASGTISDRIKLGACILCGVPAPQPTRRTHLKNKIAMCAVYCQKATSATLNHLLSRVHGPRSRLLLRRPFGSSDRGSSFTSSVVEVRVRLDAREPRVGATYHTQAQAHTPSVTPHPLPKCLNSPVPGARLLSG
eukprot:COSAG01_NODE_32_length_35644_cov_22.273738_8_plen_142_part_00